MWCVPILLYHLGFCYWNANSWSHWASLKCITFVVLNGLKFALQTTTFNRSIKNLFLTTEKSKVGIQNILLQVGMFLWGHAASELTHSFEFIEKCMLGNNIQKNLIPYI